ncbi:MAG: hypothetical protein KF795_08755 [Labilithrix sp.]|nr:hypothetical protein [Labilithrix sp.]
MRSRQARSCRERAAAHARRERLEADVRRAAGAREALLSSVAHDVRAQLAAVTMVVSSIARDEALPEAHRRKLVFLQRAAKRIERLVDDLREVGQLEAGTLALERALEGASSIVDDVVGLIRPIAAERGVVVVASVSDLTVPCARDRIVKVLERLGSSAVGATPRGGTVRIRAEPRGGRAWFAVEDERLSAPMSDPSGAPGVADTARGVELAVAEAIVDAHGGTLRSERLGAGGLRFYFDVALDGSSHAAGQDAPATRASSAHPRCGRRDGW